VVLLEAVVLQEARARGLRQLLRTQSPLTRERVECLRRLPY
jgi:hypothetical protein